MTHDRDSAAQPVAMRSWWPRRGGSGHSGPAAESAEPRDAVAARRALPPALASDTPTMEACRLLRGNLPLTSELPRPLVVISPAAEERCALIAAGLAATLSEEGRNTLLVDADLRAPLLHTLFGLTLVPGFAEMLAHGGVEGGYPIPITETLTVLPAGRPRFSPAVIFRRQRAEHVAEALARQYDTVIYHIAGTWTSPELLALVPRIGAALFVIRAGVETAEHVRRIKEPLQRSGVQFLGFVLLGGAQ